MTEADTIDALTLTCFLNALDRLNRIPARRLAALQPFAELKRAERLITAMREEVEARL